MTQPAALITGASSGIGEALALEYARRGFHVALFARRAARLAAAAAACRRAGAQALALRGDVARRADLDRAVARCLKAWGRLDVVVANAGYSLSGRVEELSLRDYRRQFAVNVEGVLHTVWASLPALKASRGRLGIVGSVVGWGGLPAQSPYTMSKFALRALAESLWSELAQDGVSVTHLAPGFIASEIRLLDRRGRLRPGAQDYVPASLVLPAAQAAHRMANALQARQRQAVITWHGRATVWLYRFLPGLAARLGRLALTYKQSRKARFAGSLSPDL